jgi:hypothetical protein
VRRAHASVREAAYSDLVTAVLDLRSPTNTITFDQTLADAIAADHIGEELARQLRWLQRQSVRDVVDQAASVLPAALVAMEQARHAPVPGLPDEDDDRSAEPGQPAKHTAAVITSSVPDEVDEDDEAESVAPADLTARRLLVAGLRPIHDPPFP